MKVTCSGCNAMYDVPADYMPARTVKTKCSVCSTAIVIGGGVLGWEQRSTPVWLAYVGHKVRMLNIAHIMALYETGEVRDDTLCFCAGMSDWNELRYIVLLREACNRNAAAIRRGGISLASVIDKIRLDLLLVPVPPCHPDAAFVVQRSVTPVAVLVTPIPVVTPSITVEDKKRKRAVPPRLRYKVLERDEHRCRSCGVHSSEPGVKLQMDHIVPWSKGGETTYDNLQTLCWACNIGKGNMYQVA
jgi:hypothetical protein